MYKIGITERDEAYLNRLVSFLKEHHSDTFDIHVINKVDAGGDKLNLDSLDLEAVQYDAIFIGDNIELEGELPAEIVSGFITEKEESSEQYINKYQSLEKIYKHMFEICEEGRRQKELTEEEKKLMGGYCLNPETVEQDGETYRIYHIEESMVDMLAIKMLTANHILGLGQIRYNSGELRLRITNMKTLYEMVQRDNTPEGKQELLKIFGNMVSTALSLEEYMLSADRLILNPKEIFLDEAEGEAIIPYIPIKDNERKDIEQCLGELKGLCDILLEGLHTGNSINIENSEKTDASTQENDMSSENDMSLEILQIGETDFKEKEDVFQKKAIAQYISRADMAAALTLSDKDIIADYRSAEKSSEAQTIRKEDIKEREDPDRNIHEKEIQEKCNFERFEQGPPKKEIIHEEEYGSTEAFENLQSNAKESLKLKNGTTMLGTKRMPFIIRKRTGEKVRIDRNIFKLGKDDTYVDYCIKDNPTISRNHADIVRKADGFYLVDKGSLNHTFVDGEKLRANEYRKLNNGCLMQLADEVFEFVMSKK